MAHRLFIAIRLPQPVIDRLFDLMEGVENARWQSDEQLHLTLRFIGEVDRPQAEDLAQAISAIQFAPFDLQISGVGHFEKKGKIHAIWAGVEENTALTALQARVEHACQSAGLAAETRKFTPHVTVARLNQSAGDVHHWLNAHPQFSCPTFTVQHFFLCESHLSNNGSIYQYIARFPQ